MYRHRGPAVSVAGARPPVGNDETVLTAELALLIEDLDRQGDAPPSPASTRLPVRA